MHHHDSFLLPFTLSLWQWRIGLYQWVMCCFWKEGMKQISSLTLQLIFTLQTAIKAAILSFKKSSHKKNWTLSFSMPWTIPRTLSWPRMKALQWKKPMIMGQPPKIFLTLECILLSSAVFMMIKHVGGIRHQDTN